MPAAGQMIVPQLQVQEFSSPSALDMLQRLNNINTNNNTVMPVIQHQAYQHQGHYYYGNG